MSPTSQGRKIVRAIFEDSGFFGPGNQAFDWRVPIREHPQKLASTPFGRVDVIRIGIRCSIPGESVGAGVENPEAFSPAPGFAIRTVRNRASKTSQSPPNGVTAIDGFVNSQ